MAEGLPARRARGPRRGLVRRLLRRRDGGATVDFAAWLPLFAISAAVIVDVTLTLAWRANLDRATIETTHALARGEILATDASAYLKDRLFIGNPDIVTVYASVGSEANVLVTRNEQTVYVFSLFGYVITYLPDGYLSSFAMVKEPS